MSFVGKLGQAAAAANSAPSSSGSSGAETTDTSVASTGDVESVTDTDEYSVRADESTSGDENLPVGDEDTQGASSETNPLSAKSGKEAAQKTSAKEVITVTDEQGRRRRLEIDYSDRAKIRRAHELAAGARKWQAERDQALGREKELTGRVSSYDLMEKAWAERGEEGVVDLLAGRKGAYQERIQRQMERAKFLANASPEEVQALKDREEGEANRKRIEAQEKRTQELEKKLVEKEEAFEMRALESQVHPVFHKHRFAGRLGNEAQEQMLDEMLWNTTLKRLEPYDEQGILSPELFEREFAAASRNIRQLIGNQADKKVARTVAQKKQEATENVQAKVMSGYSAGGEAKEARDLVNSGNTRGLLKNWSKMGKYFK